MTSAGLRVRRVHAGRDPFVFPVFDPASTILLEEGLHAPALRDLLLSERRPVLLTGDGARTSSLQVKAVMALKPSRTPHDGPARDSWLCSRRGQSRLSIPD